MGFEYKWKTKARITIKPEVVAKELERIRKKAGMLKPDDVVKEASKKTNPLHAYFEWDQTKAAHQYRLWQARHLIAVLVVSREEDDSDDPLTVRAYAHMVDDEEDGGERHYINMIQGLADPTMRQRILANALKELASFRRKYADLREFAALFAEMDKIAI